MKASDAGKGWTGQVAGHEPAAPPAPAADAAPVGDVPRSSDTPD